MATAQPRRQALGVWDPTCLEQVLLNLLINAVRCGAHSPIEVGTEVQAGRALGCARRRSPAPRPRPPAVATRLT
ncbi:MAG TPA: hypothetical protein VFH51_09045 [Myxococcota bacterium]|nr:hypothetical protein [Myxococcota bacterium]